MNVNIIILNSIFPSPNYCFFDFWVINEFWFFSILVQKASPLNKGILVNQIILKTTITLFISFGVIKWINMLSIIDLLSLLCSFWSFEIVEFPSLHYWGHNNDIGNFIRSFLFLIFSLNWFILRKLGIFILSLKIIDTMKVFGRIFIIFIFNFFLSLLLLRPGNVEIFYCYIRPTQQLTHASHIIRQFTQRVGILFVLGNGCLVIHNIWGVFLRMVLSVPLLILRL